MASCPSRVSISPSSKARATSTSTPPLASAVTPDEALPLGVARPVCGAFDGVDAYVC